MPFRILFVDSYDSFTYNVVELIKERSSEIEVITIHNDTFESYSVLRPYLKLFDAIVVGPGPGNPVNGPSDIGIIASLFDNSCVCLLYTSRCV